MRSDSTTCSFLIWVKAVNQQIGKAQSLVERGATYKAEHCL